MIHTNSSSFIRVPALGALALLAAVAAIAYVDAAFAQYPSTPPPGPSEAEVPGTSASRPRFSADAAIQPGDRGSAEVRIDYRLGRGELLFERSASGYRAGYEIRVIFLSAKGNKQVAGDSFTHNLKVSRFSETTFQGDDIADHVTFSVPPGRYVIEVALTDLRAERTSTTSLDIDVPGVPAGQLWFTDLSLGTARADSTDGPASTAGIDPNPSRRFGENLPQMVAVAEIVDNRPAGAPDSTYHIQYEIISEVQLTMARGDTTIARHGTRTPFQIGPHIGSLDPGTYRFVIALVSPATNEKGKKKGPPLLREKTFTVEQTASNVTIDSRKSIEVLRYIASDPELNAMDRLSTPEGRRAFWEEFWRQRDPTPETAQNEAMDEFYKRVQYANQHFGAGGQGWKSDMGGIYITFGQPDEIVRNPFRFEGPPEEIWYYYRARKTYFFVDKDGFGRYELDPARSQ